MLKPSCLSLAEEAKAEQAQEALSEASEELQSEESSEYDSDAESQSSDSDAGAADIIDADASSEGNAEDPEEVGTHSTSWPEALMICTYLLGLMRAPSAAVS